MQIWLDTINLEVVANAAKAGIISEVTTNPSILSRTSNVQETLNRLLEIQPGPIAVQVTSQEADDMVEEAAHIFDFSDRIIIKIPVCNNGLIAMKKLREREVPVLGTAIFHPSQALLAANSGAKFISPYFARIDEIANSNEVIKTIVGLLQNHQGNTKLLVASLKNLDDLIFCSVIGADAVTIKDDLYYKLVANHDLLEKFTHKFLSDWKLSQGNSSLKDLLKLV